MWSAATKVIVFYINIIIMLFINHKTLWKIVTVFNVIIIYTIIEYFCWYWNIMIDIWLFFGSWFCQYCSQAVGWKDQGDLYWVKLLSPQRLSQGVILVILILWFYCVYLLQHCQSVTVQAQHNITSLCWKCCKRYLLANQPYASN